MTHRVLKSYRKKVNIIYIYIYIIYIYIYIYICINFVCHVQMSKHMYEKPRHLFIKKLYIYINVYIYNIYIYMYIYIYIYVYIWGLRFFMLSSVGFVIFLVRNLLLGLTPEKFLKFGIFPNDSSSSHRGTDEGWLDCYCLINYWLLLIERKRILLCVK